MKWKLFRLSQKLRGHGNGCDYCLPTEAGTPLAYYVGFDTKTLYLGKMNNDLQPLAEFDLAKLDCKVVPGVWNQIRIAAEGPRMGVWFNRMHPSADKDQGLRIDYTDQKGPILSGAVGIRAHCVDAWFDNVAVLPIEALPE